MSWRHILFFSYCTLATLFLFISGLLSYTKSKSPFMFLLLLPLVGYFIYYLSISVIKKKELPVRPASKSVTIAVAIIFLALVSGSLFAIMTTTQKKQPEQSTWVSQKKVPPTVTPQAVLGTIRADNNAVIRVREKPSTQSAILGKTRNGKKFPILDRENDWVQIQFIASTSGWIHTEFITQPENAQP